jgi:hypothetical protein
MTHSGHEASTKAPALPLAQQTKRFIDKAQDRSLPYPFRHHSLNVCQTSYSCMSQTHYPFEAMTMWAISTRVNKPENDDLLVLNLFSDSFFEASCRLGRKSTGRCL